MAIRILADSLINQIAAGEVVERPASVVKELIENALDAGADHIIVDVIDGGRTTISVMDNGRGMPRKDLVKCVMRHATSKLADDDLLNISTMGFRGEAMPSIASVSDMTVSSFYEGEGLKLDCSTLAVTPNSVTAGTIVRVDNLFMKTPARLKFLRSDRFELAAAREVLHRLALARPDVGFLFNQNDRFPKGQDILERVLSVTGSDCEGRLREVDMHDGEVGINGFVSDPGLRRASAADQFLFVNGRPVKDKLLVGALRAAFFDVMHAREFPVAVLYINLPNRDVDVNVHPAKTEVHFLEPSRIRSLMVRAVRKAIADPLNKIPGVSKTAGVCAAQFLGNSFPGFLDKNCVKMPDDNGPIPSLFSEESKDFTTMPLGRAIGQIFNKYILAENSKGLVLVDQHAAHERIAYEKLRSRKMPAQPLLVPKVISMRPSEAAAVLEAANDLAESGLVLEDFGNGSLVVREVPVCMDAEVENLLKVIATEVRDKGSSIALNERLHSKLANFACHRSVRAGRKLSLMEMDALLRDIENTDRGGVCNHGRPVYKEISIAELDAMFERS
ncbi:MAG: DNA mismatch repair endonuclease MutL [Alphaproteobacteria bacterium]|nr:DNA mismatch repair endonuclease MutL [Alphaproteobacteria bacterium]